jgi:uncharacterized membrane protein
LWSRVGGDMLDLFALGSALGTPGNGRGKTALSLAAVAGVTALDVICAQQTSAERAGQGNGNQKPNQSEASVIINRSSDECYQYWRNVEQAPQFMAYIRSVRVTGDRHSHWVAVGPGNVRIEWDAEIVDDEPGRKISWRALPGSGVSASGTVAFEAAPANRGTIVTAQMEFDGPASALIPVARLIGKHPEQIAYKNLRRFKQLMEVGEVITTEGQSAGRSSGSTWLDEIAR